MLDDRDLCVCGHDRDGHAAWVPECAVEDCYCDWFLLDVPENDTATPGIGPDAAA